MRRAVSANIFHFVLTGTVMALPFIAWGQSLNWKLANITPMTIFPLLGMWAYSLMWTHYVLNVCKHHWPDSTYRKWHEITTSAVLVLILLHPAILIYQGQVNDFNAVDYVGEENHIWMFFAYFALAGFLLWEMVIRFKNWKIVKNYKPIWAAINNAAFVAIFFHAINLGTHLQSGWLMYVWWFYGISGILMIFYYYFRQLRAKPDEEATKD